jgi:hypothetical protein
MKPPARRVAADSAWLQIATPEAGYAGSVVTLVARISRTASGRRVLEAIRDSGRTVRIDKPDPPTDPPNAWTRRRDSALGEAADVVIEFDPADWPQPGRPDPTAPDVVLFDLLEAAARMVGGDDDGAVRADAASPAMEAYLRERAPRP